MHKLLNAFATETMEAKFEKCLMTVIMTIKSQMVIIMTIWKIIAPKAHFQSE